MTEIHRRYFYKRKQVDCNGRWPTPAGKATVENPLYKFEKIYKISW